jgi:pimeloyl-ACP methyl ester carboxylesterase
MIDDLMTTSAPTDTAVRSAVLLPGTGSDEVFVSEVFAAPLAAVGISLVAPAPGADPAGSGLAALDAAEPPVLAGGISAGAHLAAEWAVTHPQRCAGLLVAMPGWLGAPGDAPASLAARLTVDAVQADGLDAALARATAGVPGWLAAELARAWRRHGDGLAAGMSAAACRPAPGEAQLRGLRVPVGITGCDDDPVHPASVAARWAAALPRAELRLITMADLAADREALGRAALLAWLRAGGRACFRSS